MKKQIIIIIIIIIPCEFFTLAFIDGLLQESERQQVFSSLQDSPQFYCYGLAGLYSFSDFHLFQSLYQAFMDQAGIVSQNSRQFYTSHSPGHILVWAYIICTLPIESPFPPSRV